MYVYVFFNDDDDDDNCIDEEKEWNKRSKYNYKRCWQIKWFVRVLLFVNENKDNQNTKSIFI